MFSRKNKFKLLSQGPLAEWGVICPASWITWNPELGLYPEAKQSWSADSWGTNNNRAIYSILFQDASTIILHSWIN